jgi:hypothetical protein
MHMQPPNILFYCCKSSKINPLPNIWFPLSTSIYGRLATHKISKEMETWWIILSHLAFTKTLYKHIFSTHRIIYSSCRSAPWLLQAGDLQLQIIVLPKQVITSVVWLLELSKNHQFQVLFQNRTTTDQFWISAREVIRNQICNTIF